jgi:hypothetical protein
MQRGGEKVGWSTATLGFAGLVLSSSAAFAAPPQARPHLQSQIQAPAQHLDLRAPSYAFEDVNGAEKSSSAFPLHRQNLVAQQRVAPQRVNLPALGLDDMRARPTVQDFVRRVHREGLPVARLFESKGALVHLGLNPKGKPGLWLVQKTR